MVRFLRMTLVLLLTFFVAFFAAIAASLTLTAFGKSSSDRA
jgi:hypothetical protein